VSAVLAVNMEFLYCVTAEHYLIYGLFTGDVERQSDHLCGLVGRVSGYRYRGPGFDLRRYQIFSVVVCLKRGPLSLVSLVRSIEKLLE